MLNSRNVTRCLVAVLCAFLVAGPAHAQGSAAGDAALTKLKTLAVGIPAGSPVQVRMKDGSKLSGRIGPVDNNGFDLQTVENGNIVSKRVAFDQVGKLSQGAPKGKLRAAAAPLLAVLSLLGTVGAVTAAIRK